MKRILFDSYNKVQNPYGKFLDMVAVTECGHPQHLLQRLKEAGGSKYLRYRGEIEWGEAQQ